MTPFGEGLGAGDRHHPALVVRAVARDVDDPAGGVDAALAEELHGEVDRARDRGALGATHRLGRHLLGKSGSALGAVEDAPRHDHPLVPGAGPFEVDDRDLAEQAAPDGVVDLGRAEGIGEALPLQRELVHVHRVGDVDRDHEGEVDLGIGAGRRSGRDREQDREARQRAADDGAEHVGLLDCGNVASIGAARNRRPITF